MIYKRHNELSQCFNDLASSNTSSVLLIRCAGCRKQLGKGLFFCRDSSNPNRVACGEEVCTYLNFYSLKQRTSNCRYSGLIFYSCYTVNYYSFQNI